MTSWTKTLTSTGLDKKLGRAVTKLRLDGVSNNEELLVFIKSYGNRDNSFFYILILEDLCKFDQDQINSDGCKRSVLYEVRDHFIII